MLNTPKNLVINKLSIIILAAFLVVFSGGTAAENKPPNPLDMMQMMSIYLGGEVSPQQLFDIGIEANMRVPMQHLGVRFVDLRTNKTMNRDAIAKILGNTRQDWSHDLILQTLTTFSIPQVNPDTLIDVFNAAALASMRVPPEYIDIEFYDQRVGFKGKTGGGISGSVPTEVYHEATNQLKDWNELSIVDYFVANNLVYIPKENNHFIIPFSALAISEHHLVVNADNFIENKDQVFVSRREPFYDYVAVGLEKDQRRFIGLLHLSSTDLTKVQAMQKRYKKLYGKNETSK